MPSSVESSSLVDVPPQGYSHAAGYYDHNSYGADRDRDRDMQDQHHHPHPRHHHLAPANNPPPGMGNLNIPLPAIDGEDLSLHYQNFSMENNNLG